MYVYICLFENILFKNKALRFRFKQRKIEIMWR